MAGNPKHNHREHRYQHGLIKHDDCVIPERQLRKDGEGNLNGRKRNGMFCR